MLVVIASDDAYHLGVLSSRIHELWALAQGGRLGYGNDPRYNKSRCFETFPFPDADAAQAAEIRHLAESIDAHRKARQRLHPGLGLTDLYNAVAALRAGRALSEKESDAAERGLAATLAELHRRLDRAVGAAYGLPPGAADADVLARLVALNAARRAEEGAGQVRYLRPLFQAPGRAVQTTLATPLPSEAAAAPAGQPWPRGLSARIAAARRAVEAAPAPVTPAEAAAGFAGATPAALADVLDALVALGLLHAENGRYSP